MNKFVSSWPFPWTLIAGLLFSLTAYASTDQEKRKIIESEIAQPLPHTKIFYHWGTKSTSDSLIQDKIYTKERYNRYHARSCAEAVFENAAGNGIYVAETPASSSDFCNPEAGEGGLVEVMIKKGTKFIDLSDKMVLKKLEAHNLTPEDVIYTDPSAVIKYTPHADWWVVKSTNGVSFRPFSSIPSIWLA